MKNIAVLFVGAALALSGAQNLPSAPSDSWAILELLKLTLGLSMGTGLYLSFGANVPRLGFTFYISGFLGFWTLSGLLSSLHSTWYIAGAHLILGSSFAICWIVSLRNLIKREFS